MKEAANIGSLEAASSRGKLSNFAPYHVSWFKQWEGKTDLNKGTELSLGHFQMVILRSFHLNNPSPQCWQRLGTHHNLQSQLSSVKLSFATKSPILTCLSSKRKPPHAWPLLPVTSWGSSLVNLSPIKQLCQTCRLLFRVGQNQEHHFWWMWFKCG